MDFVAELIRSGHRPGYAHVETAYLRSLGSFIQARQLYRHVKVPVTLVYGEQDWSTPEEREATAKLIPHSTLQILGSPGHFSALERPEEDARILMAAVPSKAAMTAKA